MAKDIVTDDVPPITTTDQQAMRDAIDALQPLPTWTTQVGDKIRWGAFVKAFAVPENVAQWIDKKIQSIYALHTDKEWLAMSGYTTQQNIIRPLTRRIAGAICEAIGLHNLRDGMQEGRDSHLAVGVYRQAKHYQNKIGLSAKRSEGSGGSVKSSKSSTPTHRKKETPGGATRSPSSAPTAPDSRSKHAMPKAKPTRRPTPHPKIPPPSQPPYPTYIDTSPSYPLLEPSATSRKLGFMQVQLRYHTDLENIAPVFITDVIGEVENLDDAPNINDAMDGAIREKIVRLRPSFTTDYELRVCSMRQSTTWLHDRLVDGTRLSWDHLIRACYTVGVLEVRVAFMEKGKPVMTDTEDDVTMLDAL